MSKLTKLGFLAKNRNGTGYLRKPSQISDVDLKRMAGTANRRLYELEKAGLQQESAMYRTVEKYAIDKNSSMYNVKYDKGTIRLRTDVQNMSAKERAEYVQIMRNMFESKTGTVSGTRRSQKKAFESFKKNLDDDSTVAKNLTEDDYKKVWKAYRKNVKPGKNDHMGSETIVHLLEDTKFAKLSPRDIDQAMRTINQAESGEEAYTKILRDNPFIVQDI